MSERGFEGHAGEKPSNVLDFRPGLGGMVVGERTHGGPHLHLIHMATLQTMICDRNLGKRAFGFLTAVVVGCCTIVVGAGGQSTTTGLGADCSAYESVPLPAEAESVPVPKTAPACASYRSYRGIGRPVNYAEARACAWKERAAQGANLGQNQKEPVAWVVGGSLILADMYFNGAGVKRDVRLALRFACESEEEMAKLALEDLAKTDRKSRTAGPVEFCDYAATTFTENFCSGYESEVEDDRRSRYYDSLKPSMSADQRAAFEKLLAAQDAYIEAHAREVDQGGTIRAIRTMGSQAILKDLFRTELARFERKKWPVLADKLVGAADALLDRELKMKLVDLGKQTEEEVGEGAVTSDNLSKAETAWEAYRDAWVGFARLRYPSEVDQIRAEITLDRYRFVKTIHSYGD